MGHRTILGLAAAGLLAAAPTGAAWAQGSEPADAQEPGVRRFVTVQAENDMFISDRWYTNGLQLSFGTDVRPGSWLYRLLEKPADVFLDLGPDADVKAAWSVGQIIITPDDYSRTIPDPKDRPYAGWTYVAPTLSSVRRTGNVSDMRSLSLQLGLMGPNSGAGWTQRWWHDVWDFRPINGWAHELPNEGTIALIGERRWRLEQAPAFGVAPWDMMFAVGGSLGTVQTSGSVSGGLRVGTELGDDFGPPRIRPGQTPSLFFSKRGSRPAAYAFATVELRGVAHDVFLDGNLFRDDTPRVEREPWVRETQIGAVVMIPIQKTWLRLTYAHVDRSKEFVGQPEDSSFNALSASLAW